MTFLFETVFDNIGGVEEIVQRTFNSFFEHHDISDFPNCEDRARLNRDLVSTLALQYGGAAAVIYTEHLISGHEAHVQVHLSMPSYDHVINVYVSKDDDSLRITNKGHRGWSNWAVHCNGGVQREGQCIFQTSHKNSRNVRRLNALLRDLSRCIVKWTKTVMNYLLKFFVEPFFTWDAWWKEDLGYDRKWAEKHHHKHLGFFGKQMSTLKIVLRLLRQNRNPRCLHQRIGYIKEDLWKTNNMLEMIVPIEVPSCKNGETACYCRELQKPLPRFVVRLAYEIFLKREKEEPTLNCVIRTRHLCLVMHYYLKLRKKKVTQSETYVNLLSGEYELEETSSSTMDLESGSEGQYSDDCSIQMGPETLRERYTRYRRDLVSSIVNRIATFLAPSSKKARQAGLWCELHVSQLRRGHRSGFENIPVADLNTTVQQKIFSPPDNDNDESQVNLILQQFDKAECLGGDFLLHNRIRELVSGPGVRRKFIFRTEENNVYLIGCGDLLWLGEREALIATRKDSLLPNIHTKGSNVYIGRHTLSTAFLVFGILAAVGIGIATGSQNLLGRGSPTTYSRIYDSVSIAGGLALLLIGVIKLISDDGEIIRNTLLRRKKINGAHDLLKITGCLDEVDVAIEYDRNANTKWINNAGVCYLNQAQNRSGVQIRELGTEAHLLDKGIVVVGSRVYDMRARQRDGTIKWEGSVGHIVWGAQSTDDIVHLKDITYGETRLIG